MATFGRNRIVLLFIGLLLWAITYSQPILPGVIASGMPIDAGPTYHADYQLVYDTLVENSLTPSETNAGYQNTLVARLDTAGVTIEGTSIWDDWDLFYVLACEDSAAAAFEWTDLDYEYKIIWEDDGANPMTFTQYEGFTHPGDVDAYGNLSWNPTDDGDNFTLNDASMFIYTRVLATWGAATGHAMGSMKYNEEQARSRMAPRTATNPQGFSGQLGGRGSVSDIDSPTPSADSIGLYGISRQASDSIFLWFNNAIYLDTDTLAYALASYDFYIFNYNYQDSHAYTPYQDGQISIIGIGAGLSPLKCEYLWEILNDYMEDLGKGVWQSIPWWLFVIMVFIYRDNKEKFICAI